MPKCQLGSCGRPATSYHRLPPSIAPDLYTKGADGCYLCEQHATQVRLGIIVPKQTIAGVGTIRYYPETQLLDVGQTEIAWEWLRQEIAGLHEAVRANYEGADFLQPDRRIKHAIGELERILAVLKA